MILFNVAGEQRDIGKYNYILLLYSDDSLIRTRLFPVDISGLTSFQDY